jgi:HEAT repeat protein
MTKYLVLGLLLVLGTAGCRRASTPTLAGGKPVSNWVRALQSPEPRERRAAVVKLGNVGPSEAAVLPALRSALHDADAGVRREAIVALMKFGAGSADAATELMEMREGDPDSTVREYAAKATARLKSRR